MSIRHITKKIQCTREDFPTESWCGEKLEATDHPMSLEVANNWLSSGRIGPCEKCLAEAKQFTEICQAPIDANLGFISYDDDIPVGIIIIVIFLASSIGSLLMFGAS